MLNDKNFSLQSFFQFMITGRVWAVKSSSILLKVRKVSKNTFVFPLFHRQNRFSASPLPLLLKGRHFKKWGTVAYLLGNDETFLY